jgi:hypothetical protein
MYPVIRQLVEEGQLLRADLTSYQQSIEFLNDLAEDGPSGELAEKYAAFGRMGLSRLSRGRILFDSFDSYLVQVYYNTADVFTSSYTRGISDTLRNLFLIYLIWADPEAEIWRSEYSREGLRTAFIEYIWRVSKCRFPFIDFEGMGPWDISYKAREEPYPKDLLPPLE